MTTAETATTNAKQATELPQVNPLRVAGALCTRELVRFLRQGNRVFGALGQPIIFWLLFSEGLRSADLDYRHFFPGTLAMILLFTAIFATISVIEDRREGFLQSVLVAPIPRWSMVLGKVLGGTLLAMLQGVVFVVLGRITLGFLPGVVGWLSLLVLMFVVAFALTSLGFLIAWRMDSTQGFHAIMSALLLPMWLLSGSFFPGEGGWLSLVQAINPLTYGVAGLRQLLQLQGEQALAYLPSLGLCWIISLAFAAAMFFLAWLVAGSRTTGDLL